MTYAATSLIPPRSARRDFGRSPLLVFFETTQACDLACLHCRACAQTEPHPGELETWHAKLLVDQLTEFPDPPMLILTGGDPLKRADIFEIIEYAVDSGLEVSITPAATPLATRWALERLQRAGISRLAVSLDGSDALAHDGLRGVSGSFQRTLDILRQARELGIPAQVNTVVTRRNYQQVDAMAELLRDEGIVLWSLFFLVPVGRGALADCLSAEQSEEVFETLWRQSQRQAYLIKTTEAPQYRRFVIQHQHPQADGNQRVTAAPAAWVPTGLNDGKGVMFIGHTGLIHPSGFMPILCGMFPLHHVVRVYQDSPIFQGLRDPNRLEGKCRDCEFRALCGGSRARAYALTNNPYAEEPFCNYNPRKRQRGAAAG